MSLSRLTPLAAVAAGATLFGVAVGGLASVDGELRAAAPAAAPQRDAALLVQYRPDCPERPVHWRT
jgi:hypothetical protein